MSSSIIKKIREKNLFFRFSIFCLALYVEAIIFNLFYVPANITAGGASGLSIVIHQITGFNQGNLVTLIYVSTVVLSFIFLDLD